MMPIERTVTGLRLVLEMRLREHTKITQYKGRFIYPASSNSKAHHPLLPFLQRLFLRARQEVLILGDIGTLPFLQD